MFIEGVMVEMKRAIKTGDLVPDCTLPVLNETNVRLSDYRGRKLIMFVWASW